MYMYVLSALYNCLPNCSTRMYTVFQKSDDIFKKNYSVKNKPILVIFYSQNPEETSYQTIINVSTLPVKCIHCTLRKADNVHLIEAIYIKTH